MPDGRSSAQGQADVKVAEVVVWPADRSKGALRLSHAEGLYSRGWGSMLNPMGYQSMMSPKRSNPVRRAMAGVLLLTTVAGILPWHAARAMACRMDRPVAATPAGCGLCGAGSAESAAPSLTASSCCRFAAPEEVSTLPAFTQGTHRAPAGDERVSTALPVESYSASATAAAVKARATSITQYSSAPQALSTQLRL